MKRWSHVGLAVAVATGSCALAGAARADEIVPSEAPTSTPNQGNAAHASAPRTKPPTVIGLRVDGGYSLRKLVALPLTGGDVGVALGARPEPNVALWGTTRMFIGSTEHGLSVYTWRLGGDFDYILDRVRVGLGLNLFVVGVGRAVRDDTIVSWGPALHGGARVDVVQAEGFTLFLRADIDAGWEVRNGSIYWGPTLGAGVDFDISGTR